MLSVIFPFLLRISSRSLRSRYIASVRTFSHNSCIISLLCCYGNQLSRDVYAAVPQQRPTFLAPQFRLRTVMSQSGSCVTFYRLDQHWSSGDWLQEVTCVGFRKSNCYVASNSLPVARLSDKMDILCPSSAFRLRNSHMWLNQNTYLFSPVQEMDHMGVGYVGKIKFI
jgi:hypothetical protein